MFYNIRLPPQKYSGLKICSELERKPTKIYSNFSKNLPIYPSDIANKNYFMISHFVI